MNVGGEVEVGKVVNTYAFHVFVKEEEEIGMILLGPSFENVREERAPVDWQIQWSV